MPNFGKYLSEENQEGFFQFGRFWGVGLRGLLAGL